MSQKTDVVGAAAAEPHSQPAHARYRRTTRHDSVPAEDDDDSNDDVNPQLCKKASASALPRTIRVHDDKNTALLEDAELPSSQTRLSFQAVEDDFPEFAISQRELFFFYFLQRTSWPSRATTCGRSAGNHCGSLENEPIPASQVYDGSLLGRVKRPLACRVQRLTMLESLVSLSLAFPSPPSYMTGETLVSLLLWPRRERGRKSPRES